MSHHVRKLMPGATRLYRFPTLGQNGEEVQSPHEQFEYGYQQGLDQGHEEGHQAGYQHGADRGFAEGEAKGVSQGMTKGYADGLVQGRAAFEQALIPFASLQRQWESLSRERMAQQKELISQLVAQVAKRVIQAEYTLNPQQVLTQVEKAMGSLSQAPENLVIYLNQADKQRLAEQGVNECQGWPLQVDAALGVGDARLETEAMVIDVNPNARLETCLEQVESSLEQMLDE
ncbi:MAG: FliH/SctL family protein [Aeromonas sp.]